MTSRVLAGLVCGLAVVSLSEAGMAGKSAPSRAEIAQMEKMVLKAPGAVRCYTNPQATRLVSCEKREMGIQAFLALYQHDRAHAVAVLERRFAQAPDVHGVFFPILAASLVKDPAFVDDLAAVRKRMPRSSMARWADAATSIIETQSCAKVPRDYAELCP